VPGDRARSPVYDWAMMAGSVAILAYIAVNLDDLLFRAASETMLTIAADPKHLGARIGMVRR
jgi:TRAP-type uncharacterized transport system fused permease subunit